MFIASSLGFCSTDARGFFCLFVFASTVITLPTVSQHFTRLQSVKWGKERGFFLLTAVAELNFGD